MRDLNLDFVEMFPLIVTAQVRNKKGSDLNELLKEYEVALNALPKVET